MKVYSKHQRRLSEFKQVKEWPIVFLNYVQCSSRPGLFKEFFPENKSPGILNRLVNIKTGREYDQELLQSQTAD